MSKNNDYTFGHCDVDCDGKGCHMHEQIDGFDGHPPQYADVNKKLRDIGWTIKKDGADWVDLCSSCSEKS